jgi:hypothetical protein
VEKSSAENCQKDNQGECCFMECLLCESEECLGKSLEIAEIYGFLDDIAMQTYQFSSIGRCDFLSFFEG